MTTACLWMSNGRQCNTGYGNQTDLFAPRIKAEGYTLSVFDFVGGVGRPYRDQDGIMILPRFHDAWGSDMYQGHMKFTKARFSIGLFDFFAADPDVFQGQPHAQWTPVDGSPLRPDNADALRRGARWVMAMSRFGEKVLRAAGFDPLYVPHGVSSSTFQPIDREEARAKVGKWWNRDLARKFIFAMNAANHSAPSRKGFYEALAAFKEVAEKHKNALLYIHTDYIGGRGEDLRVHIEALGIDPERVIFPDMYAYAGGLYTPNDLNTLMNAADVYLSASHAEGFGIPIIEAQMAGCPVILPNNSAQTEL
jgi:glycosyltransferase involved in cell wall biosynthesis